MKPPPPDPIVPPEWIRQREALRKSFLRTHTALAGILVTVLALAFATTLFSWRSRQSQWRAETAERESRDRLWSAQRSQARAIRLGQGMGRRFEALAAISNAASLRYSPELRDEAIATLALVDLEESRSVREMADRTHRGGFSPGLDLYVVMEEDRSLSVHRSADHKSLLRIRASDLHPGSNEVVQAWAFSEDARRFAVAFKTGSYTAWDLTTGDMLHTRTTWLVGQPSPPCLSSNGEWLAVNSPQRREDLRLRHLTSGAEFDLPGKEQAAAFSFRPGAHLLASCEGATVRWFDLDRRREVNSLSLPAPGISMAWSRDGRRLAVGCLNGDIAVWDFDPEHHHLLRGHSEGPRTLRFSPRGDRLLSSTIGGGSRLWDVEQGRELVHAAAGEGLEFSGDGSHIGYFRSGRGLGTWRIHDAEGLRTLNVSGPREQRVATLDLSPEGQWLIAGAAGRLQLWDLQRPGPPCVQSIAGLRWAALHPDESQVIIAHPRGLERREIRRAEGPGQSPNLGPPDPMSLSVTGTVEMITISGDGHRALVELSNKHFVSLDLSGRAPPVFLDHVRSYSYTPNAGSPTGGGRAALSPDGRWAAIGWGGVAQSAGVWDTRTGRLAYPCGPQGTTSFSPDGRWLMLASGDEYQLLETRGFTRVRTFPRPNLLGPRGTAAFARDSATAALLRTREIPELIDVTTGESLACFTAPDLQNNYLLRLSSDGRFLAAAGLRNTIHLWDVHRIQELLSGFGLGWDRSTTSRNDRTLAPPPPAQRPLSAVFLSILAVALTTVFAILVLSRHRQLVLRYFQVETLAEQRNHELERTRVELLHSQKMQALGTLAAGIAHDFNNLLSVIRMSNKLIAREVPDHPGVREHVDAVEEAILQGRQVVRSMLGYSRSQPERTTSRDVDEIVEETVSLLSREFLSGITLTLELDRHLPAVLIGEGRLEQILLNLVVNAAEAMKGHGRLRIATCLVEHPPGPWVLAPRAGKAYAELIVEDNGPGIPDAIRDRIFDPFFTTKQGGHRPGTGLGLSMVYNLASQEGLGLSLRTAVGGGAQFRVHIPLSESLSNPAPKP